MGIKEQTSVHNSSRSLRIVIKYLTEKVVREAQGKTAKTIGYILSSKVIAHIFNMISGIIIARYLGAEGKGILTTLFVIPIFIAAFGHLGLPISNIYFIGQGRKKETLLINSVYFIFSASFLYAFICLLIMPILNRSYFSGIGSSYLAYMTLIMIPLLLTKHFFVDFLRGIERYKEYNYTNLFQHGLRMGLLICFIYFFDLTVEFAFTAVVVALVLSDCYSYIIIKQEIPIKSTSASRRQFRENISYGLKEYIGNLFATLNVKIDILILAAFMSKGSIGIYSVALAIASLFQFVPESIGVILLPKIAKTSGGNTRNIMRKSFIFNAVLLSVCWVFFIVVGRWLIQFLYGEQFSPAYSLAVIIIFGSILLSFTQIINKYFSGIGRPEIKSITRGINIPIKAASLYFLVGSFGLEGAAWAFAISTASLLLLTLYFYSRTKKEILRLHT